MGYPSSAPEVEVSQILANAVATTGCVLGTNLFRGPMLMPSATVPRACTFVFPPVVPGPRPAPYLGIGQDDREFIVQVLHRGSSDGYEVGAGISRAIWTALHRASPLSSGYYAIYVREPDPLYIGLDNLEQPRWVMNIRLWYKG
jgi:hypothetical protein